MGKENLLQNKVHVKYLCLNQCIQYPDYQYRSKEYNLKLSEQMTKQSIFSAYPLP